MGAAEASPARAREDRLCEREAVLLLAVAAGFFFSSTTVGGTGGVLLLATSTSPPCFLAFFASLLSSFLEGPSFLEASWEGPFAFSFLGAGGGP